MSFTVLLLEDAVQDIEAIYTYIQKYLSLGLSMVPEISAKY
jgi:hypothetical protein